MELHFYTTFNNIQNLKEGKNVLVWTKEHARPNEIHISLDTSKYAFNEVQKGVYEVSAIYTITVKLT